MNALDVAAVYLAALALGFTAGVLIESLLTELRKDRRP